MLARSIIIARGQASDKPKLKRVPVDAALLASRNAGVPAQGAEPSEPVVALQ